MSASSTARRPIASFDGTSADGGRSRRRRARAALASAPDDRGKHRDLARALLRRGALDELERVLADWQKRDPLDGDAIALRAELSVVAWRSRRRPRVFSRASRLPPTRLASTISPSAPNAPATTSSRARSASRPPRTNPRTRRASPAPSAASVFAVARHPPTAGSSSPAHGARPSRTRSRKLDESAQRLRRHRRRRVVERTAQTSTSPSSTRAASASAWLAGRGRVQDATSRSHEKLGVGPAAPERSSSRSREATAELPPSPVSST